MCEIKIDELKFSSKVIVKCHRCASFILNVLTESGLSSSGLGLVQPGLLLLLFALHALPSRSVAFCPSLPISPWSFSSSADEGRGS